MDELESLGTVGVFSRGIARIPHLGAFLGAERVVFRPDLRRLRVDTVVGWGRKPNTARARAWAEREGCRYVMLEDGFLRSLRVGLSGEPPLSLVVDDQGIYYDATAPSRLERLVAEGATPEFVDRAARCMQLVRTRRLSKYNDSPDVDLGPRKGERVLVVDQTAGDLSVRLGLAPPGGFEAMLEAAVAEHPGAEVLVKTHPDVETGKKTGHLLGASCDRVRILRQRVHPISLLSQVDHVYVMTSLMGFEALVVGKPVTCFGAPFYAGWGLTDDRVSVPRRGVRRSVEEVFAAAYLRYARYVDPETGRRCELERTVEHLSLQREMADANRGTTVCLGFSAWKRGFVPSFLQSPGGDVRFARDVEHADRLLTGPNSRLLVWGTRDDAATKALASRRAVPVWRMEDGFLRSVGLGSDFFAPASLVVDRRGIYYDPTRPSDLECILQEATFTEEELRRARSLREAIVAHGISKYNVGTHTRIGPPPGNESPVVLVVGQVEDDASIQLGCVDVRRNRDLLRRAREARPDAWIVFKPHPDVVRGNRAGAVDPKEARRWCDEVAEDASLSDCLAAADEVHTMTSLVGFESLLRKLPVVVYGLPFYAGWGLTHDRITHARRTRRLDLDELVAGTLIRYPRYVSRVTGTFTTPEVIVRQIREAREREGSDSLRTSRAGRELRKALNLLRGVLRAP